MKHLILDGNQFSDLSSFYEVANTIFMKGVEWKLGESLDAFNDILYGGFGVFEPKEKIDLTWINHEKSKVDLGLKATVGFYEAKIESGYPYDSSLNKERLNHLIEGKGQTLYEILIEIVKSHRNINLILK